MGRSVSSAPYPNTCLSYYTGGGTTAGRWGFRWVSLRTASLPQHPVCWRLLVALEEHFLHAPRAKMRATVHLSQAFWKLICAKDIPCKLHQLVMSMMICEAGHAPIWSYLLHLKRLQNNKVKLLVSSREKHTSWSIQRCTLPSGRLLLKMYLAFVVFVLPAEEHQILSPLQVMGKNTSICKRPCQFCVKHREQ